MSCQRTGSSSFPGPVFSLLLVFVAAATLAQAGPPLATDTGDKTPVGTLQPLVQRAVAEPQPDDNPPPSGTRAAYVVEPAVGPSPAAVPNSFQYVRFLGTDLQPRTSTTTFAYNFNGCIYETGGTDNRFMTSFNLPQGSSLKFLRIYYDDTLATNLTAYLTKYNPGVSSTDIVTVTSSGTAGYGSSLSAEIGGTLPGDPPAEVVNNTSNSYTVIVAPNANAAGASICGVRIAYYPPPQGELNTITPCRIADTRDGTYPAGFGPPSLTGGAAARSFTIPGRCGVPAGATAYSLNFTVVAPGGTPPGGYLTVFPTGVTQPVVSTLNFGSGSILANAAVVPAGTNGAISVFVNFSTNLIIDVNGYFY